MNNQSIRISCVLIALFASSTINAQVSRTANGIIVKAGTKQVGLFAANNAVFCISLNDSAAPAAINSIFIDDKKTKNVSP